MQYCHKTSKAQESCQHVCMKMHSAAKARLACKGVHVNTADATPGRWTEGRSCTVSSSTKCHQAACDPVHWKPSFPLQLCQVCTNQTGCQGVVMHCPLKVVLASCDSRTLHCNCLFVLTASVFASVCLSISMCVKVHCTQSTMLSVTHAVYRYVKETLYLSLCVSVGTSILAACVTIRVLDRTIFVVLNLNAAVLVQMPCPSHHCGARMVFRLQLYCRQVSICSAAKANSQELYAY